MEAGSLGLFMISACVFGALLDHPGSPIHKAIADPVLRRALGGLVMGLTLIGIVFSPWGQRSGAHMNPFVTLSFLMLGKIERWDAMFYIVFQFLGGIAGVLVARVFLEMPLRDASVNYVVTRPGPGGPVVAFWAEFGISLLMMSTILMVSNSRRLSRLTPFFAGALVAAYITVEAPLSGMSMNAARTVGSAFSANQWTALWVYFTAPFAGMMLAAFLYRIRRGVHGVFCAKLHHCNGQRCIFRCQYGALNAN
jgi:aquaporin Z